MGGAGFAGADAAGLPAPQPPLTLGTAPQLEEERVRLSLNWSALPSGTSGQGGSPQLFPGARVRLTCASAPPPALQSPTSRDPVLFEPDFTRSEI